MKKLVLLGIVFALAGNLYAQHGRGKKYKSHFLTKVEKTEGRQLLTEQEHATEYDLRTIDSTLTKKTIITVNKREFRIDPNVLEVFPEAGFVDVYGHKHIDYRSVTALLVEAVQEQTLIIEELTQRLEALENKKGR